MDKSEQYLIKTTRLGFRQWREDDLNHAIGLWGDYEVTKYFDMRGKLSNDEVQERLAKEITAQKKYGVQYWPVFLLESNVHVGCCGLRHMICQSRLMKLAFTSVLTNGDVDTAAKPRLL